MQTKKLMIKFLEEIILLLDEDFTNFCKLFSIRHKIKHLMTEEEIKNKIEDFLTFEKINMIKNHNPEILEDTFFFHVYNSFSKMNQEIFWKWLESYIRNKDIDF